MPALANINVGSFCGISSRIETGNRDRELRKQGNWEAREGMEGATLVACAQLHRARHQRRRRPHPTVTTPRPAPTVTPHRPHPLEPALLAESSGGGGGTVW